MTKTAELLAVYRELVFLHHEVKRLTARGESWKRKFEEREKELESERLDHKDDHEYFREKNEMIDMLADRLSDYDRAVDPILDLIGAVIEEDAELDGILSKWKPDLVKSLGSDEEFLAKIEPTTTMDIEEGTDCPARCLSCNEPKEGYYLCEPCFELDQDHDAEVFNELQDAWDAGARDFPRPGKNIKEMYK